jgi:hypothetical protein
MEPKQETEYVDAYVLDKEVRNTPPDDVIDILKKHGATQEEAVNALEFIALLKRATVALTVDEIEAIRCCHRAKGRGSSPAGLGCELVNGMQQELGLRDAKTWDALTGQILSGCIEVSSTDNDIEFRVCSPDEIITKHRAFGEEN